MKFTKKFLKDMKKETTSRLKKRVINDLLGNGVNTEDLFKHMEDIVKYGCQSGCVSSLIYYKDTTRFFDNYRSEILEYVNDYINECSEDEYLQLNKGDIVISKNQKRFTDEEKNFLTWFIYEEIVNDLLNTFYGMD